MLYNVLVGFVFAQLHYTTKKAASFLFLDAAFSFTAPIHYDQPAETILDQEPYTVFPFTFAYGRILNL